MTDLDHIRDMDPEDAYDAGDPVLERILILHRALESIREERATDDARAERRRRGLLELVERFDDELAEYIVELHTIRDRLAAV